MFRTFNCGIGMVVCVRAADVAQATALLTGAGESVYEIGHLALKSDAAASVVMHHDFASA